MARVVYSLRKGDGQIGQQPEEQRGEACDGCRSCDQVSSYLYNHLVDDRIEDWGRQANNNTFFTVCIGRDSIALEFVLQATIASSASLRENRGLWRFAIVSQTSSKKSSSRAAYIHSDDVCHGRKGCQPSANLSEKSCVFKCFGLLIQLAMVPKSNDSFFYVFSTMKENVIVLTCPESARRNSRPKQEPLSHLSTRSAKSRNPQNLDRPTGGAGGSLGEDSLGSSVPGSWLSLGRMVGDSMMRK